MSDEYIEGLRQRMEAVDFLTSEEKENIIESFAVADSDASGFIEKDEIFEVFKSTYAKPPAYKIRECLQKYDTNNDKKLSIEEFSKIYSEVCPKSMKNTFQQAIQKKSGIVVAKSKTAASAEGTQHSYSHEERIAFCNWINQNLANDPDLKGYVPISEDDEEGFFKSLSDGIVLCKLINFSQADTIDRRAINLKRSDRPQVQLHRDTENLNLALNSASAIGCNIVNIGATDIKEQKAHLVMGMLWQVIRIGLFSAINLQQCPGLAVLLYDGESIESFLALPPDKILLRWMNYHLANSERYKGTPRGQMNEGKIENFGSDIKDSYAYLCLLEQIAPVSEDPDEPCPVDASYNKYKDDLSRARGVLKEADKIECRAFVSEHDIVKGHQKLNMAFVANLFNKYPALEPKEPIEPIEETREEKTYRNWMNSLGVSPRVNRIYNDLNNGLVYMQLYKAIDKDSVDDSKVQRDFTKIGGNMKKIENCNYAVNIGKNMNFSLVGIGGKDLNDGHQTNTLALTWQLMRGYTLAMLKNLMGDDVNMKKIEPQILEWANTKLESAGKESRVKSMKDSNLRNSLPILDLCDSIVPNSVDYENVNLADEDEDTYLDNARYAVSMCRKIGARVYTLPEDIAEVNQKMLMTLFACLMTRDLRDKE